MTIHVHYRVPVVAEVDVDRGEVIAVHLIDEQIEGPLQVLDATEGNEPKHEARRRAIEVAGQAAWPGWRTGW